MALSVRLRDDYMKRLDYLAKKTNRPKTFYVKELFNRHFDELEDIYLAETALEEFKKSGEKTISLDEMRTEIGLDD
ncbi:CopG family transcriptional regulator [Desulfobacula sp.]|uniref:type II toxin-antitoxin system RelB family antitoxin n=1 Tax=Desulfobacula sp. TaxID=2593537 RepID=UPI00261ABD20|nr:CopG family transcriptional regulator [Desulfobacula sp.]